MINFAFNSNLKLKKDVSFISDLPQLRTLIFGLLKNLNHVYNIVFFILADTNN